MTLRRRTTIAAGMWTLAAHHLVFGQPVGKMWRIGLIAQDGPRADFETLIRELRRLGYEEHRDMIFDFKNARGQLDRLSALAAELALARVDLIVAARNNEVQAARTATKTIPIVMMLGVAPVETGLINTLARPGTNVTGTTGQTPALAVKQIDILRETKPDLKRIAILFASYYSGATFHAREAERACAALNIGSVLVPVHTPDRLETSLRMIDSSGSDAILVSVEEGISRLSIWPVIAFASHRRLPAMYSVNTSVRAGGFISYSAKLSALARRNAWMIQRILNGVSAIDIPVEKPAEFEMAINLRTAKALGLTIPKSVMLRADEVIQ